MHGKLSNLEAKGHVIPATRHFDWKPHLIAYSRYPRQTKPLPFDSIIRCSPQPRPVLIIGGMIIWNVLLVLSLYGLHQHHSRSLLR